MLEERFPHLEVSSDEGLDDSPEQLATAQDAVLQYSLGIARRKEDAKRYGRRRRATTTPVTPTASRNTTSPTPTPTPTPTIQRSAGVSQCSLSASLLRRHLRCVFRPPGAGTQEECWQGLPQGRPLYPA